MLTPTAAIVEIRCNCEAWLAEVTLTGQRQRLRLRACRRCRCRPVVFVDEVGRYVVASWPCPVDTDVLPWPETGWR